MIVVWILLCVHCNLFNYTLLVEQNKTVEFDIRGFVLLQNRSINIVACFFIKPYRLCIGNVITTTAQL